MWKQVILSIVRRDRCILIKYSPYIKWECEKESTVCGVISQRNELQMTSITDTGVEHNCDDQMSQILTNNVLNGMVDEVIDSYLDDTDEESP